MILCKECGNWDCTLCGTSTMWAHCPTRKPYTPRPMTNADKIRSMSDEELAVFFRRLIIDASYPCHYSPNGVWTTHEIAGGKVIPWLEWLQQEVEMKDG